MGNWSKEQNIRDAACWLSRKVELIELKSYNKINSINQTICRGGIFNVELGVGNLGGEKNKKRPCLVISRNQLNIGDTVVVIPLSTKFKTKTHGKGKIAPKYDNHLILWKSKYGFLDDDSCIKCEDIRMVDKVRIQEHIGNIEPQDMNLLKKRLLFTFDFK
ncbi:type II toxin-antitoxin system PemK/MazF family toxin [Haloimpatiens massiliensis]|uniref:type II toxin-antitoxin system PemK/MazF family toxin n=1 Tax=Haloimpatiens massiliensis TaxID=1658110 RepID=UPI000C83A4B8|nr:type II toxin-antitoxin system PemK/MazF family toxin [Haloimpatiens massiliensis]